MRSLSTRPLLRLASSFAPASVLRLGLASSLRLGLGLGLSACAGGQVTGPDFEPPPPLATASVFVVTTDFQTGSYAVFSVDAPGSPATNLGRIHGDAVALHHDGVVYVINRLGGDSIQALDPQAGFATLWECSVGNGANPHDLIFAAPDKAYVTLYEQRELLIVDPTVGPSCHGFVRGSVDLGPLADADGLPEMDVGTIRNGRLYVTLQRLDRIAFFQPSDFSAVAVIDVATDTLLDVDPATPEADGIRLTRTNPFSGGQGILVDGEGRLVLGEVGSFGVIGDGGIELVDPVTMRATAFLMTEEELGGNLTDFVLVGEREGYAIVTDLDFANTLVRFDPTERRVTGILTTSEDYLVDIDLEPARGEIYLTDRTLLRPGIRIFRTGDGVELTPEPIDTGLPPFDVVFLAEPGDPAAGAQREGAQGDLR
jgi:DNA-binding beta-propeller fold protein YncE